MPRSRSNKGASPHTEAPDFDPDASKEILRHRLAKKKERLQERNQTVSAQRLRIRELEEEVERLTEKVKQRDKDFLGMEAEKQKLEGYKQAAIEAMSLLFKCTPKIFENGRMPQAHEALMTLKSQCQTEYSCPNAAIKDVLHGAEAGQDE
jgi:uncharacterized coiled-coil protein SlyX